MSGRRASARVLGSLLAAALGCGSEQGSEPAESGGTAQASSAAVPVSNPPAVSPEAARVAAEEIFATRCTACHGPQGRGDGPASAGLTPPPRNFHEPAWQTSVSDSHIEQIIQYGGAAVGRSPAMPSNPDLMSKPEIVAALRAHVRGLGKQ